MIDENKLNEVEKLLKEGYVYDKELTQIIFNTPYPIIQFQTVTDDNITDIINYIRYYFLWNNNILLAVGQQKENDVIKYSIFKKFYLKNKLDNELNMKITPRGFSITDFKDVYGRLCSLQESSSANDSRIWLGIDGNRMLLSQEHVKMLLPYLQNFVETGELKKVTSVKYKYLVQENNVTVDVNKHGTSISYNNISSIDEASYTNNNFIVSNNTSEEAYFKISSHLNKHLKDFDNNTNLSNNFLFTKEAADYFSKQIDFRDVIFYKLGTKEEVTNEKN